MKKCGIIGHAYYASESFTEQGTWNKVKKYLKKGYHVGAHGKGNGNWLITKPAQAVVVINDNDKAINDDFAGVIKDYYEKDQMSESLFNKFLKEEAEGILGIYNSDGYYVIEKYDVLIINDIQ